jgi:hypothetical protein
MDQSSTFVGKLINLLPILIDAKGEPDPFFQEELENHGKGKHGRPGNDEFRCHREA